MVKMKNFYLAFMIASLLVMSTADAYSGLSIEISPGQNSICPSYTLTSDDIGIVIKNLGDSRETYRLSLELPGEGDWSGFITPTVTISPGEEGGVDAIFITPSYGVAPGVYKIGVIVSSEISGESIMKEIPVEILKCHWVDIEADDYELCQGITSSFEINVSNEGNENEEIIVSASEPWVDFPVSEFVLKKGERKTLEMVFYPPTDEEGMRDVTISVRSSSSYARNVKTIKADVSRCYAYEVEIIPSLQEVCPCQTGEFILKIKNTGIKEDVYEITYDNKSSKMNLKPGESVEFGVSLDVSCEEEPGNYSTEITIDSHLTGKSTAAFSVLPMTECYSVVFSDGENVTKSVEVGNAVTYHFTIENKGGFERSYELTLDAPDWMYLSESELDLVSGESKEVYVYAAPQYNIQPGKYYATVKAMADNEQDSLEFGVYVMSGFAFGNETADGYTPTGTEGNNITMNISIPTGGIVASGETEAQGPWTQIIMITILATGVIIIIILRFVVMMK